MEVHQRLYCHFIFADCVAEIRQGLYTSVHLLKLLGKISALASGKNYILFE